MKNILTSLLAFVSPILFALSGSEKPISEVLYPIILEKGSDSAIAEYHQLRDSRPEDFNFKEGQLNILGYRLLHEGRPEAAIKILKLNLEMYPDSLNVYDSLGEAYWTAGKREEAEACYRQVLSRLETSDLSLDQKIFFRNNARSQLLKIAYFDPPSADSFNYVSFYGGLPAGRWDAGNLKRFKDSQGGKFSYRSFNLYRSPVPTKYR